MTKKCNSCGNEISSSSHWFKCAMCGKNICVNCMIPIENRAICKSCQKHLRSETFLNNPKFPWGNQPL